MGRMAKKLPLQKAKQNNRIWQGVCCSMPRFFSRPSFAALPEAVSDVTEINLL
jgi:hypothetical protein